MVAAEANDVLELDERWTYVRRKVDQCWLWLALCCRTRQIVADTLGDRDAGAATDLCCSLKSGYEQVRSVSDLWPVYDEVFDPDLHQSCAYRGETNRVERLNATLRYHLGRLTRKTLSFSKSWENHSAVIHLFLLRYNQQMAKKLASR